MFIDTHCHINMMIKKNFDVTLSSEQLPLASEILKQAEAQGISHIINVGTSLIESANSVYLAQSFNNISAAVGIHPNDCTATWKDDFKQIITRWFTKKNPDYLAGNKIVAIGECGLDRHYPDYNIQRQYDAFKAHIELALEHNKALIIHTRDAGDETLKVLEQYKNNNLRGVIHCFSEDQAFADYALMLGFVLGIGGTLTYPKNNSLRTIFKTVPLEKIILETDAPFLPPQDLRGQQNNPKNISLIAQFLADLRAEPLNLIAQKTTENAQKLFSL